jgi:UDP-sugar transporter A1/2/3
MSERRSTEDVPLEGEMDVLLNVNIIAGGPEKTVVDDPELDTTAEFSDEDNFNGWLKNISLVLLTLQNCTVTIALKYSRTDAARDSNRTLYLTTTAVAMGEVLKLCLSVAWILYSKGVDGLSHDVKTEIIEKPAECAKMIVPSLLYTIQNNLVYSAMTYISVVTFQVTMQLKILTTAVFSMIILGKVLQLHMWKGLAVLTLGCIFVNLDQSGASSAGSAGGAGGFLIGVIMTVTAACTSGFAGVYFEKRLKGARTSLWIRQIQMAFGGAVMSFAGCALQDGKAIQEKGFFQGYTPFTLFLIVVSASGGLIIAVVVKYADNLYKAFAVSLSIVLSSIVSVPIFNFAPRFVPLTSPQSTHPFITVLFLITSTLAHACVPLSTLHSSVKFS